jgi:hypothetical protein
MGHDLCRRDCHIGIPATPALFSPSWKRLKATRKRQGRARMGAAKRPLDAEDRFEILAKGETSATNPGAQTGSIAGKDRGRYTLPTGVGEQRALSGGEKLQLRQ